MGGRPNAGVLILLHLWLIAAAAVAVSPGASLSSNLKQSWSSPNGTFSLRFIRAPGGDGSFIAAVTYASIWIWNAGGTGGVVDSGAALQFLTSGNLRLVNGSGSLIWESGTANLGISGADVEDSGELVLRRGTTPVWSSFDHLTDTVVQGQNFTAGQIIRRGLYSFTLESWGNLTLRWNDTIVYWTKGLNSSFDLNLTSPSLRLDPLGIINLYDPQLTSIGTVVAYSSDYGDSVFRFLRLDDDGNLRIHSSARDSRAATERWAAVDDQCKVFAYCGNFGICSYDDVRTICGCPSENFDPVDRSDPRRGCRRKAELDSCPGSTEMLELDSTILLTFSPESSSQVYPAGISGCHFNCLRGMACVASTNLADGMGQCYQKYKASFISGYRSPVFHSTSFLKICGPAMMNPSIGSDAGETRNDSRFPAWIVVFVVSTVLVIDDVLLWWWCRRNPKNASPSMQYALLEYSSGAPVQFTHRELHQSTRGFREKLGEGGFGAVYRGTLANRAAGTHHLNLVRLIGFCSEGKHRLLVYEFMKNGSLDNFIFSESPSSSSVKPAPAVARVLDWECRFRIAIAMARRIMYLHEECSDCIVHCDIKLENILLDKNFNARVSDFGLAKLINPNDHRNRTLKSVRGTRGCLAPEWLTNLLIMSKSDIYSFGMILLEIVSGRRNYEVSPETNQKFSAWAYGEFERGEVKNIVDRRFGEVDIEQATRMITVGFWCIQEQPSQRPIGGMITVVQPPFDYV